MSPDAGGETAVDEAPSGMPAIVTVAMPEHANPGGDIFGGWLLGQLDQAAGIAAWRRARGRCVSVSIAAEFIGPVKVGDAVSIHASIETVGRSSMTVRTDGWARARTEETSRKVITAQWKFVALGSDGRPVPLPAD